MRALRLTGVVHTKKLRTTFPSADRERAGRPLNQDFTAAAPSRVWVTNFTYVRTWVGFGYIPLIAHVFAQKIVAGHACTRKGANPVMPPLQMGLWQRDRENHPVTTGKLTRHSDARSQNASVRLTEHPALEAINPSNRIDRRCLRQHTDEDGERPAQSGVYPHYGLAPRPSPESPNPQSSSIEPGTVKRPIHTFLPLTP